MNAPTLWIPNRSIIPPCPPVERRIQREKEIKRQIFPGYTPEGRRQAEVEYRCTLPMLLKGASGLNIPAPTAFWRLQAGVGSTPVVVSDTTENGHDLDDGSSATPIAFGAGYIGNCANNFGAGAGATTPFLQIHSGSASDLGPTTSQFFACGAWVNSTFLGGSRNFPIMSKRDPGTTSYQLMYNNFSINNRWCFMVTHDGSTTVEVNNTATASTGIWYFLVATYDKSNINLYVNNVKFSTAFTTGIFASAAKFRLGGQLDVWRGSIDAAFVYIDTLLSDANVTALYNGIAGSGAGTEFYSGSWH